MEGMQPPSSFSLSLFLFLLSALVCVFVLVCDTFFLAHLPASSSSSSSPHLLFLVRLVSARGSVRGSVIMATNFWTTVLNWTYARGYIRVPIVLAVPIVFNKYGLYQLEPAFQRWNDGHNQRDIWNRLREKVANMEDADADTA